MTIEEAIKHFEDQVSVYRKRALELARYHNYDSARYHQQYAAESQQIANWLAELKSIKEV